MFPAFVTNNIFPHVYQCCIFSALGTDWMLYWVTIGSLVGVCVCTLMYFVIAIFCINVIFLSLLFSVWALVWSSFPVHVAYCPGCHGYSRGHDRRVLWRGTYNVPFVLPCMWALTVWHQFPWGKLGKLFLSTEVEGFNPWVTGRPVRRAWSFTQGCRNGHVWLERLLFVLFFPSYLEWNRRW